MKIKKLPPPSATISYISFPREEGGDITFSVKATIGLPRYADAHPAPKGIAMIARGGIPIEDKDTPAYKALYEQWEDASTWYLVYHSIKDTPDLEFDTVKPSDWATLDKVETELMEWLTFYEVQKLIQLVHEVNGVTRARIDEATQAFIAKMAAGLV